MKGLFAFIIPLLGLAAYGIGTIAGLFLTLTGGYWLLAACIVALAAMGFPTAKKFYGELTLQAKSKKTDKAEE